MQSSARAAAWHADRDLWWEAALHRSMYKPILRGQNHKHLIKRWLMLLGGFHFLPGASEPEAFGHLQHTLADPGDVTS